MYKRYYSNKEEKKPKIHDNTNNQSNFVRCENVYEKLRQTGRLFVLYEDSIELVCGSSHADPYGFFTI